MPASLPQIPNSSTQCQPPNFQAGNQTKTKYRICDLLSSISQQNFLLLTLHISLPYLTIHIYVDVIASHLTMPATRKSTRGAAARTAASKGQSTLSFNHKVTKSGTAKSGKASKLSTPTATKVEPERQIQTPTSEDVEEIEAQQPEEAAITQPEVEKSAAELSAEKVTDAQIKRYWKGVEAARISKRVHQEGLSQAEKVLRYFDVSSQYGPCIGIPRAKRWYRAEKLGLNPPIEVLAVLLREDGQGNKEIERAAMDRLMESTAIGSG